MVGFCGRGWAGVRGEVCVLGFVLWLLLFCGFLNVHLLLSLPSLHTFRRVAIPPFSASPPLTHAASGGPSPPVSLSLSWKEGLCVLLHYYFTKGVCSFFRSFLFSPEPSFPTSLLTQLRDPSLPPCSLQRFWVGTQESFTGHWCLFFSLQVIWCL